MTRASTPAVLTWLVALLLLAGAGCGTRGAEAEDEGLITLASTESTGGVANRSGVPTTGGLAADDGDDDDEREDKDYWAPIPFDRTNFEEVRQQVKKRYIDPNVDEGWAYAEAATWALASSDKDGRLLLPEAFYKIRKDNPEEKGSLKGAVSKLHPNDGFVILDEVKDKPEEEKKRLSDDEIRTLRAQQQARARLLREEWHKVGFGAKDFDRVMAFIKKEYKATPEWTVKTAWIAAAQGYLYSLDPHSSLMPKSAWDDSNDKTTDSSFDGIGAILTQRPDSDYTIVESPMQGQPAVKAGLRAGDVIIKVDGKDIKGESLSKVVSRIRGKRGTRVGLTITREGEPEPRTYAIERQHIEIKNVQGHLVDHHTDIGYIKITGFVRTTDLELGRVYRELEAKTSSGHLRGLVLDLRNNSGGLLNQGIDVSNRFIPSGTIVAVKARSAREDDTYMAKASDTWDMPLVVLVNDGTASAAEIVASAIQDNRRGLVIGDRTFGKASVQTLYSPVLQDDYFIKLTVARYYSPSGRTLQVTGVIPDITVAPEIGGKMPLGFREENLSGHLVPLDFEYVSANKPLADRARRCVEASGIAKKVHDADPNPAIRFDYQLSYGEDALECMIAEQAAAQMATP
ncbi:MAG: S41 family peptidase [Myxococcales bacterium]|nr:S41 family peptidase [Myxococcales bacterium]MCB9733839.1 S41 family peptidase [Deltaproteobacteria bacterium]